MSPKKKQTGKGMSTKAVHGGETHPHYGNAITVPITQSSTFVFTSAEEIEAYTSKKLNRFEYARYGYPTQAVAEKKLAELEGAEEAMLFASGMSAVVTTLLAFLSKGDHMIITSDAYKKTYQFATAELARFGVGCSVVDTRGYKAMAAAIKPDTRLIFSESPTNPYLNVIDLERFSSIARKRGVISIIDATFATPVNQRPIEFGVDLVMHSATKYLGGHNDLLAGVLAGSSELLAKVREFHKFTGGVLDPHCCYMLIRGLKTLQIRVARQNASTQSLAEFLESHKRVRSTFYPGLPSHPDHKVAKSQMSGFGGVVSFEVDGDRDGAKRFLNALKLCQIGPSLGGPESLITNPALLTYNDLPPDGRAALKITDQLMRLAVGLEDPEDIMADLDQALAAMD